MIDGSVDNDSINEEPAKENPTTDLPTIDSPVNEPIVGKLKPSKRKLIIIIAASIILLLGTGTLVFALNYDNFFPPSTTEELEDEEEDEQSEHDQEVAQLPTSGYQFVRWHYASYVPTNELIKARISDCETSVKYFTVAELSDDAVLLRADKESCYSGYDIYWFVMPKSGNAKLVGNFTYNLTEAREALARSDTSIIKLDLPELVLPNQITANGKNYYISAYSSMSFTQDLYASGTSGTPISTQKHNGTDIGTLYQTTEPIRIDSATMPITGFSWEYITPDKRTYTYQPYAGHQDVALNDDATLKASWVDVSNKDISFRGPLRGCGTSKTAIITGNLETLQKTKVATLTAGNKSNVYKITDSQILNMLATWYIYEGSVTMEDIQNKVSNITYQNQNGDWIFLVSTEIDQAECGKPVIYLYPEKLTTVSVTVGANISLSDPLYPAGGWQNVLAHPSGQLIYRGTKYDSLFWEGTGHGPYPDVSGIGIVVAQKDLVKTIRSQLYAQGLTTKETNDFLEFWVDHLPKTPWVKLTWLSTRQMNQLAPLAIRPKPTTLIRIFLDAEGVSTPMNLTEQKFSTPKREGFTVVEWGGLLR
ncbi:hypothetical protein FWF89_00240 [Candidatus Saccharibacteria bacterium]|nr:hypothetical protein [Candidatus Saccharibacteria bacterium]